jgi:hypothetical protein
VRCWIWLVLLVTGREALADAKPPATFNDRVLALIDDYPDHGFGGYAWPARKGTAGTTRDLRLDATVIARGGTGNHCVGMTFEVFWRALELCPGGTRAVFDARSAAAARLRWYVPEDGGLGPAEVLPALGLGKRVDHVDARPGDFVQAWNEDGTFGHSFVFLGWERDTAGKLVKIRYWSTQPWTDGIGVSDMAIGDGSFAFDLPRIHIVRATCRGVSL